MPVDASTFVTRCERRLSSPVVTTVTTGAPDDLTDADYHDIYNEVRGLDEPSGFYQVTLRQFIALIADVRGAGCLSIAYWSKYHRGEIALNRQAKGELRALVGRPPLQPTVAEAVASVSPRATVHQVGADPDPSRLIIVATPDPVTLHVDGTVTVIDPAAAPPATGVVTPVTRPRSRKVVSIRPALWARLNQARQTTGQDWNTYLAHLLDQVQPPTD